METEELKLFYLTKKSLEKGIYSIITHINPLAPLMVAKIICMYTKQLVYKAAKKLNHT